MTRTKVPERVGLYLAVAAIAAAGVACARPAPHPQRFSGVITRDGKPVTGLQVRFLSDGPENRCSVPGLDAVTDESGRFRVEQLYRPTLAEGFVVVIHPYRLCVAHGDTWTLVWQFTTGPAPDTVDLDCTLTSPESGSCKVSWDGRPAH
jgi:hypothetical protein